MNNGLGKELDKFWLQIQQKMGVRLPSTTTSKSYRGAWFEQVHIIVLSSRVRHGNQEQVDAKFAPKLLQEQAMHQRIYPLGARKP